ncbi:MAG TPA: hypothetical protein VHL10_07215 [Nitrososphaera sp.]|jgi:hypothetical protein|nr:hypothetical protein [Nitrososphaera sp.]
MPIPNMVESAIKEVLVGSRLIFDGLLFTIMDNQSFFHQHPKTMFVQMWLQ